MARVMFAVFAQRVSVDRFNNVLDIHGVIEQVTAPAPNPEVLKEALKRKGALRGPFSFQLVIHWRRSNPAKPEATFNSQIVLVGPKGQKLVLSKQVVNLRQNPYLRGLITYPTLPVVGEGTYTANIMVQSGRGWKRAGQASFEVTFGKVALAEIPAGGSRRLQ